MRIFGRKNKVPLCRKEGCANDAKIHSEGINLMYRSSPDPTAYEQWDLCEQHREELRCFLTTVSYQIIEIPHAPLVVPQEWS